MSQRESGYERVERDLYETPAWVTESLLPHLGRGFIRVWEPACGSGKMVRALEQDGLSVIATDISTGTDFLTAEPREADAIITNPPYELAREFVEHALDEMAECQGLVAMLLRTDFDHAATRQHLFSKHPAFAKKIVLTKRIVWFERKGAAPSFNHAWYLWDWKNRAAPVIAYGPER